MRSATMPMNDELDRCVEICTTCARTCLRTLYRHCLPMGGAHASEPHVQVMTDCSEVCRLAADFMIRGSPRHGWVCALCAELCQACADECATMDGMEACVTACRRCADACRAMAA